MNNPIIVADASPLIAFGRLDLLSLLTQTLGAIIVPESVAQECTQDKTRPGAIAIQKAIQNKILTLYPDPQTDLFMRLNTLLGCGESTAIALAVELQAGVLIDEKLARAAAQQLHLKIIGTAGVLLLAKQKKVIASVLPLIKALKKAGYYLSDSLIHEVVKMADEI